MLVADKADVTTKEKFGDVQLHLEWQIPADDRGEGQDNGNSGVKLMGQYEVEVIHSHKDENKTYADGIAGAIYGQYPPLVNAARPRGQWQTYDIVWRAPRRDATGEVVTPAYVTVLLNGVLVQDHAEILGNTSGPARGYKKHGDQEPILLQWHGHPIRYRNIWVRRLDAAKVDAKYVRYSPEVATPASRVTRSVNDRCGKWHPAAPEPDAGVATTGRGAHHNRRSAVRLSRRIAVLLLIGHALAATAADPAPSGLGLKLS